MACRKLSHSVWFSRLGKAPGLGGPRPATQPALPGQFRRPEKAPGTPRPPADSHLQTPKAPITSAGFSNSSQQSATCHAKGNAVDRREGKDLPSSSRAPISASKRDVTVMVTSNKGFLRKMEYRSSNEASGLASRQRFKTPLDFRGIFF